MQKLYKDMLPERNELPASTYEAKRVVCSLGLEVEKIHACPNDYILYRGKEYEKLEVCPMCEAQRYKISRDDPCDVEGVKKKKIPLKVVWYSCEGGVVFSSDTMVEASIQVQGQCKEDVLAQRACTR
jgi:hypothetical protein